MTPGDREEAAAGLRSFADIDRAIFDALTPLQCRLPRGFMITVTTMATFEDHLPIVRIIRHGSRTDRENTP